MQKIKKHTDSFLNKKEVMQLWDCENYRTFTTVVGAETLEAVGWKRKSLFTPRDIGVLEERLGKPRRFEIA